MISGGVGLNKNTSHRQEQQQTTLSLSRVLQMQMWPRLEHQPRRFVACLLTVAIVAVLSYTTADWNSQNDTLTANAPSTAMSRGLTDNPWLHTRTQFRDGWPIFFRLDPSSPRAAHRRFHCRLFPGLRDGGKTLVVFECVTRNVCDEAPVVDFRLRGPAISQCEHERKVVFSNPKKQNSCVAEVSYSVKCRVGDPGVYSLTGVVFYENDQLSLQHPPGCATPCLGASFSFPRVYSAPIDELQLQAQADN